MTDTVSAILFDMGGTLRRNIPRDEAGKLDIVRKILALLELETPPAEFCRLLTSRADAYEDWAAKNLVELNETGLWTQWMLPELPALKIGSLAMELNRMWREAICTRSLFPETKPVILGLHQHGYRLGLVSNTTSSLDAPSALEKAGISKYFDVVVLSCVYRKRKPDPGILIEAAKRMGLSPGQCAYIGDRPDWDVRAARRAGFGLAVILRDPSKTFPNSLPPELRPDFNIDNLEELLQLFPAPQGQYHLRGFGLS